MAILTKKRKQILNKIEEGKVYNVADAMSCFNSMPRASFDERLDVAINLGIDARKSDQLIRRSTVLPNGSGKSSVVAVYAQDSVAGSLRDAGADIVGSDELVADIQKGIIKFDVLLAAPKDMSRLGRLGTILGPRGLMPNPKLGTVTNDLVKAVEDAKSGQISYRTDKNGIVHVPIGLASFAAEHVEENLNKLLSDLKSARPASAKGVFLKKVTLSTTMGPGLVIDLSSLVV